MEEQVLLNKDDTSIENLYLIPDKKEFKTEIAFVKYYRQQLEELIQEEFDSLSNGSLSSSKTKEQMVKLVFDVKEFIEETAVSNIQRKLIFIDNIYKEIVDIADKIYREQVIYNKDDLFSVLNKMNQASNLLKLEASKSLVENNLLEKMEEKDAHEFIKNLTDGLKMDMLMLSDENNLSMRDVRLLYVYSSLSQDSDYNQINSICGGCEKDDCMYCREVSNTKDLEKRASAYGKIKEACKALINNEKFNIEEKILQTSIERMKTNKAQTIATKLFLEKEFDKEKDKKFEITTKAGTLLIIKDKINNIIKNSQRDYSNKAIYDNFDLIFDINTEEQQKIHDEFINAFNDLSNKEKEVYNTELGKYFLEKKAEMEENKGD